MNAVSYVGKYGINHRWVHAPSLGEVERPTPQYRHETLVDNRAWYEERLDVDNFDIATVALIVLHSLVKESGVADDYDFDIVITPRKVID